MANDEPKVTTFLMFSGNAEEAMNHYISIFDDAEITSISRYGPGEAGKEGTVIQAAFSIKGQTFMCIDSNVDHDFTFTPAISLFVTCDSEEEIKHVYEGLGEDGTMLMPLDAYPFSAQFGWLEDKFGVSWQINLPHEE